MFPGLTSKQSTLPPYKRAFSSRTGAVVSQRCSFSSRKTVLKVPHKVGSRPDLFRKQPFFSAWGQPSRPGNQIERRKTIAPPVGELKAIYPNPNNNPNNKLNTITNTNTSPGYLGKFSETKDAVKKYF